MDHAGRLVNRVAIVTGAGSGIGRACARRFAIEGATVVVNDVNADSAAETVELVDQDGGRAEAAVGDVTDRGFVDRLVDGAVASHGRLDIMQARGIRVNAIAPGGMLTPAFEQWLEKNEVRLDDWCRQIPQGRMGEPDDIAGVALFLASDDSRYVNGAVIPVDGGALAKLGGPHAQ